MRTGSVIADNFTLILAVSYIAMVVIGGLDSIAGAVIGAAIIPALPTVVPQAQRWVAMVQREVAARLAAHPGSRVYGVPSVLAQEPLAGLAQAGIAGRDAGVA